MAAIALPHYRAFACVRDFAAKPPSLTRDSPHRAIKARLLFHHHLRCVSLFITVETPCLWWDEHSSSNTRIDLNHCVARTLNNRVSTLTLMIVGCSIVT